MKRVILFFLFPLLLVGSPDYSSMMNAPQPTFKIENRILAQVNDTTVSVLDLKKRMDILFHKGYPQHSKNELARFQFYQSSWKKVLDEIIHGELMISDSVDKELKVSDGEVHEEILKRFGPNVVATLEQIGISRVEAEKIVKDEMIVQRMMWFYVYMKAQKNVHPSDVKVAYKDYQKQNPPQELWSYQVITVRGDDSQKSSENFYSSILETHKNPEDLSALFDTENNISLSKEYIVEGADLSEKHKSILETLDPGSYSKPISQKSRYDGTDVHRIFYLKDLDKKEAASFDSLYDRLKNEIFYQEADKLTGAYISKLKSHYGYEAILEDIPDDFQPFVIQ